MVMYMVLISRNVKLFCSLETKLITSCRTDNSKHYILVPYTILTGFASFLIVHKSLFFTFSFECVAVSCWFPN